MPNDLLSCDKLEGAEKIYRHSGVSETIADSFSAPNGDPSGLTFDGINLISCDWTANKIYVHSGTTSTITSSFASPGSGITSGLAYDGDNLISCDWIDDKIFIHSGVTLTITNSFSSPSTFPTGLTFDGTNLISCDTASDEIYVHSGVTSTVATSFATPSTYPSGLAWDGTNLISCDDDQNKIYKHSGITSGITDSFSSPSSVPYGLTYSAPANQPPTAPTLLLCEGQASPVSNVTDLTPEFSAIFNDPDSGDIANAFEIEVGTSPGGSDMWDSGWIDISGESLVEGNRCNDQSYAGSALSLDGSTYYWRCRFRDDDNAEGVWSVNARFTMQSAAPPSAPVTRQGLLSQIW